MNLHDLYQKVNIELPNRLPKMTYKAQIELLKVLIDGQWIEMSRHFGNRYYMGTIDFKKRQENESFEDLLCSMIYLCYNNMNNERKQKIKIILKELSEKQ